MSKKPATKQEIIAIIEKVLIPSEMRCIADCDKELQKMRDEHNENTMFFGYQYGIRQGHLNTIETLEKTANALKGTY